MSAPPKIKGYVVVPVEVFLNAKTLDEVEDWLMLQNEDFMAELVEARRQHLAGELVSLEELKEKLGPS
jgi:hypothetical protein